MTLLNRAVSRSTASTPSRTRQSARSLWAVRFFRGYQPAHEVLYGWSDYDWFRSRHVHGSKKHTPSTVNTVVVATTVYPKREELWRNKPSSCHRFKRAFNPCSVGLSKPQKSLHLVVISTLVDENIARRATAVDDPVECPERCRNNGSELLLDSVEISFRQGAAFPREHHIPYTHLHPPRTRQRGFVKNPARSTTSTAPPLAE